MLIGGVEMSVVIVVFYILLLVFIVLLFVDFLLIYVGVVFVGLISYVFGGLGVFELIMFVLFI